METSFRSDCLEGRVALVTGASSGIGAASARVLVGCGAKVIISGRDANKLRRVGDSIGSSAETVAADLSQNGAASTLASAVLERGGVDIIVNSAGYGEVKRTQKITEQTIDAMFAVNVRAPLILTSLLVDRMSERGRGSIINVSSVVGSLGTPYQATYAATKGALDAATRSLAREFGKANVRVNAIAQGMVATEMYGDRLGNEEFMAGVADHINIGRWGDAKMIAEAVVFLASDASRYITGEVILVDGGLVRCGDIVPRSAMAIKRTRT